MTSSSADPSAGGLIGQARRRDGGGARPHRQVRGIALAVLVLAGLAAAACSGPDPIERARVAAGRAPASALPPVPGEGQPYPSLGTVPARPATIPPEQRRALEDALVADRANARYVGQPVVPTVPRAAPLPPAPAQPAAPLEAAGGGLMGAEETVAPPLGAPPVPPIAGAPVAAEALPPPPTPAQAAPAAVALEDLPPPPAPAMPEELPPQARAAASPPQAAAVPAQPPAPPPPPMATASPAAPVLLPPPAPDPAPPLAPPAPAVMAAPAAAPVPAPVQAPVQAPVPPQPSVVVDRGALQPAAVIGSGQAYALAFLPGTETLVTRDRAVLANLASRGSGATFRVTGFADEAGAGRALDLPLARARVVADALRAAGVPAEAIELGGAARQGPAGRGAEVRLVYSR